MMTNEQEEIVNLAIDHAEVLSSWEYDFINDIADKDDEYNGYALTENQVRVLDRINDKLEDANLI